ncbi:terminase small subunit [Psychrobacter sp. ANT_WB68]|uniref:terminase small subunit n=1 Tax=Psychrobacter sp. ANT_WB68 TaxID=2597355 RepID=UPI0011F38D2D|nr:terminase small subunit [Psychrobacter sp. ANT_WB68]KAA0915801.1 terminase small subunit [Psychrobacter sp. ANT_WB68]
MSKAKTLTPMMQMFVDEYIIDFNGQEAAIRAGYSPKRAAQQAYRLAQDTRITDAIDEAIANRRKRMHITQDQVLIKWWEIANADYNELSSVRRVACGYCYGDTISLDDDDNDNDDSRDIDPTRDPNPDCQMCRGEGSPHVHIADTTKLSPAAKLLYQGAKETKFGIEIQTADRMKALENVARHLGMFKDTVNHVSEDGSMKPVFNIVGVSPDDHSASGDSTE